MERLILAHPSLALISGGLINIHAELNNGNEEEKIEILVNDLGEEKKKCSGELIGLNPLFSEIL